MPASDVTMIDAIKHTRCYWLLIIYYLSRLLTHGGRVTHTCVSKLTIIGSDNGLAPGRHQAIIWINVGILLIGSLTINFNEIWIEIHIFSIKKIHLKMSSGKWRPLCLSLNVLTRGGRVTHACASKLGYHWNGPDNGLMSVWCQEIVRTNADLLSIWLSGTNFLDKQNISIFIHKDEIENVVC